MFVNLRPALREKTHITGLNHIARSVLRGITQKPLTAEARLNRDIRALRKADIVLMRLFFFHQAEFRE